VADSLPAPTPRSPTGDVVTGVIGGGAIGGALVGCADALTALVSVGAPGGRWLVVPAAAALAIVGALAAAPWAAALSRGQHRIGPALSENPRWWGVGVGAAASAWLAFALGPLSGEPLLQGAAAISLFALAGSVAALARSVRARILATAALVGAAAVPVTLAAPADSAFAPESGRDTLLVTIEGLRSDDLSVPPDTLAALIARGARFSRVVPPSPERAIALRGLHLGAAAWTPGGLHPDEPVPPAATLAEAFAGAGWATAAFVGTPDAGEGLGFQRIDDDAWVPGFASSTLGRLVARLGGPGPTRRRADRVVDRGLSWLSQPPPDPRPRFVWVHLADGAFPWSPPPPWDTAFYAGDPGDPAHADGAVAPLPADVALAYPHVTDLDWVRATRRGALASADAELGRLVAGLGDGWVVAVVGVAGTPPLARGGPPAGAPLLAPETLRLPLVLSAPGLLPSGASVADPVELTDLSSTLLELGGAPVDGSTGASLVPLAFGRRAPPFARAGGPGGAVRIVSADRTWDPREGSPPPESAWRAAAEGVTAASSPVP